MLYWYPGIGYVNLRPQYNDESSIENNDYSQSTRNKVHSRRRIDWRGFFKNRNKNYLNSNDESENAKR